MSKIPHDEMLLKFNGQVLVDGKKVKHYGIKNGFHVTLGLSEIGELRKIVRARDQTIWERDFTHNEQLQEVKARALNSLVDDVALVKNPDMLGSRAKLIYLTQGQAQDIFARMGDFIHAIHHPGPTDSHLPGTNPPLVSGPPELVLKFFGSYGSPEDLVHGYEKAYTQFPFIHAVPEVSSADQARVDQQLQSFVQEVILPVAMSRRTVVLVEATRDCGLSAVVRRVLAPVAERLGDHCPFTLVGIASAAVVRRHSNEPHSVAHRLKQAKLAANGKDNAWFIADEIQRRKSSMMMVSVDDVALVPGSEAPSDRVEDLEGTDGVGVAMAAAGGELQSVFPPGSQGSKRDRDGGQHGEHGAYVSEVVFFEEGMRVEARYWGFAKYYPG